MCGQVYEDGEALVAAAECELRAWLCLQAAAGVPELVLVAVLQKQARAIEQQGYVPRSWGAEGGGREGNELV